jgi:hypothetical protein
VGELDFALLLRIGTSNDAAEVSVPGWACVVTVTIRLLRKDSMDLHLNEVCENHSVFSEPLCPVRKEKDVSCTANP